MIYYSIIEIKKTNQQLDLQFFKILILNTSNISLQRGTNINEKQDGKVLEFKYRFNILHCLRKDCYLSNFVLLIFFRLEILKQNTWYTETPNVLDSCKQSCRSFAFHSYILNSDNFILLPSNSMYVEKTTNYFWKDIHFYKHVQFKMHIYFIVNVVNLKERRKTGIKTNKYLSQVQIYINLT